MELRKMECEDLVDLYELLKIKEVSKFTSFSISDIDSFIDYYENYMVDDLIYVIDVDGKVIGMIHFHSFHQDCCELGYYMHPQYQYLGWMKKSVLFLISHINVSFIYAYIAKDNLRSIQFIKSLGFKYVSNGEPMYLNDLMMHQIDVFERSYE